MERLHVVSAASAALLLAGAAVAQAQDLGWDMDADNILTMDEFVDGFTARANFSNWDTDGDGMLNIDEFRTGAFGAYDLDASDGLEGAEYDALTGYNRWGYGGWGNEAWGETAGGWDVDGDGILLRNEFDVGMGDDLASLSVWDGDGDGMITQEEFARAVFASYDEDSDGVITEPELTDIGDDMGDEGFWDV